MWRDRLSKLAESVEEKLKTQRDHLPGRGGKAARVEAYRGFGCADRAFTWGRVLRGTALPPADADDSVWTNLGRMAGRFNSDEVPGARVRVRFPGGEHVVSADEEGYFECWFDPRPPFAGDEPWQSVRLELAEPAEEPAAAADAPVLVPPPAARFGVISDLDDTVLRTDATRTLRMVRTVLLANARTREPFPGVSAFYRALAKGGGTADVNPVFYVSSSPWNLYDLLAEFMDVRRIPRGPLLLRDWGIRYGGEPGEGGHAGHKLGAIRRILDMFPALPFLLIGDSGQEDPEIYHRVVHQYPDRILAVYVRNVSPAPLRLEKIRLLAEEVRAAGSSLLLTDDTLEAARHAAGAGWISPDALREIAAESAPTASPEVRQANAAVSTVRPE